MKINTVPRFEKNVQNMYIVMTCDETIYLKRKKDVINYYYQLEHNANDFLNELLSISIKIDNYLTSNIKTIKQYQVKEYCKQKAFFYERLQYLNSYDWVHPVYKMNALCSMTNYLLEMAVCFFLKKIELKLLNIRELFFISNAYYKQEKPVLTIVRTSSLKLKKAI